MKNFFFLFILLLAAASFATGIRILPIHNENTAVEQATAEMLVRDAVIQNGFTPDDKSKTTLQISLMPLGEQIIVVGETQENDEIHSTKMKAESISELDVVISRVIAGVLQNKQAQSTDEIGQVTEKDQNEIKRRKGVERYYNVSLGPAYWYNFDSEHFFVYALQGGYIWEVSANAAITLLTNLAFQVNENSLWRHTLLIGGRFYFSPTSISPFVGAGLGFGYELGDEDSFYSFAGGASAGIVFFRTSELQLELGLQYDSFFTNAKSGKAAFYIGINY